MPTTTATTTKATATATATATNITPGTNTERESGVDGQVSVLLQSPIYPPWRR